MTYEKTGNEAYLVDEVAGDQKVTEAFYARLDGLTFRGDYKTQLDDIITTLEAESLYLAREDRKRIIDIITSKYVDQTGTTTSGDHLERMTDVVLYEELTDKHPDKMARNEYPIMSDYQEGRRLKSEIAKGDWNSDGSVVTGYKSSHYVDDNGTMRESRQAIHRYNS